MLAEVDSTLAQVDPSWPKLAPSEPQLGPKLAPCWPMLAQVGTKLAPSWPQVGPCWPELVQVGPSWPQVGPKMAPSWPMLAPSEPHDGPSSKVSPRLAKVFTKALPLRPRFSQMSTKALPQAFRRLIFRSGCSIVLFSNLKVVSFWVRLSDCPVMAGLSKRFIQTFLPSGSCRQLLLEASSFFVHCTKAL